MALHVITDELRHANARAASHGYGAGQIQASRLIDDWSSDDAHRHATEVLADVELAQAYAQSAPSGYDDYADRTGGGDLGGSHSARDEADLRTAYHAGFDIGFAAALVEGCGALMGLVARE
jgi:hypothetical protein